MKYNQTLSSNHNGSLSGHYSSSSSSHYQNNSSNGGNYSSGNNGAYGSTSFSYSSNGTNGNSYGSSSGNNQSYAEYSSQVLNSLLNANSPIQSNETERISVNGQSGIFLNRQEVSNWRGSLPISSYPINQDSNPQVIRKNQQQNLDYVQQVNVRYLKPSAGQVGPIIIRQEPNKVVEPAPPIIIRQQPSGGQSQGSQVYREAPPRSVNVAPKEIVIPGKTLPPPPRKVVIEKLSEVPGKPGDITIERWLAPESVKRRVIFKPAPNQAAQEKQRNVIIEWSPVKANVRQQVNVSGITQANPDDYVRQYGSQLIESSRLPRIALDVQAPNGHRLASSVGNQGLVELEGDVHALALVDLDKEGLSEYKEYLRRLGVNSNSFNQTYGSNNNSSVSYGSSSNNDGWVNYNSGNQNNYRSSSSSGSGSPKNCVC